MCITKTFQMSVLCCMIACQITPSKVPHVQRHNADILNVRFVLRMWMYVHAMALRAHVHNVDILNDLLVLRHYMYVHASLRVHAFMGITETFQMTL